MGNIVEYAKREFKAAGYTPLDQEQEDGPNKWIQENVLELLDVFEKQEHSGMSAPFCIKMFEKLASFEPLKPLYGTDDEWMEVGSGLYQNVRCSHVFKRADGVAYDIDGRVFIDKRGAAFTSHESRKRITFPYVPKRKTVSYFWLIVTRWLRISKLVFRPV